MSIMIIMKMANIYIVLTMLQALLTFRYLNPPYSLYFRNKGTEVQRVL